MRIGMTYDLRSAYRAKGFDETAIAEFDSEETVTAIADALRSLGHEPVHIGALPELVSQLAEGQRWDLVFNIAEGLWGTARESQIPCLLDAYGLPYTFSDALTTAIAHHKPTTKLVANQLGVRTPPYAVITTLDQVNRVNLGYPLFAKPSAEGTSKGIGKHSIIHNQQQLTDCCERLLADFKQPVLVERYLPGREFTVGLLGTGRDSRAIGVLEITDTDNTTPDVYGFIEKEECEKRIEYQLVDDPLAQRAASLALVFWTGLGCRDAGRIDVRVDEEGEPSFIEVNPLAGMHPTHSDLPMIWQRGGRPYQALIAGIVNSASKRLSLQVKGAPGRKPQAKAG